MGPVISFRRHIMLHSYTVRYMLSAYPIQIDMVNKKYILIFYREISLWFIMKTQICNKYYSIGTHFLLAQKVQNKSVTKNS